MCMAANKVGMNRQAGFPGVWVFLQLTNGLLAFVGFPAAVIICGMV